MSEAQKQSFFAHGINAYASTNKNAYENEFSTHFHLTVALIRWYLENYTLNNKS